MTVIKEGVVRRIIKLRNLSTQGVFPGHINTLYKSVHLIPLATAQKDSILTHTAGLLNQLFIILL